MNLVRKDGIQLVRVWLHRVHVRVRLAQVRRIQVWPFNDGRVTERWSVVCAARRRSWNERHFAASTNWIYIYISVFRQQLKNLPMKAQFRNADNIVIVQTRLDKQSQNELTLTESHQGRCGRLVVSYLVFFFDYSSLNPVFFSGHF